MPSPSCAGACLERVQDRPHLNMRPPAAASRLDVPFVQLGRNLVVARGTRSRDLFNNGADIGRKPPRIRLEGRDAYLAITMPRPR